jgi:hypothetical protein
MNGRGRCCWRHDAQNTNPDKGQCFAHRWAAPMAEAVVIDEGEHLMDTERGSYDA